MFIKRMAHLREFYTCVIEKEPWKGYRIPACITKALVVKKAT